MHKKHRFIAASLAFLLGCSVLLCFPINSSASSGFWYSFAIRYGLSDDSPFSYSHVSHMYEKQREYMQDNPGSSYSDFLEWYNNGGDDFEGEHGGGGVGGYRDTLDHIICDYEVEKNNENNSTGTQNGNEYVSYDGRVVITRETIYNSYGNLDHFDFFMTLDGNPVCSTTGGKDNDKLGRILKVTERADNNGNDRSTETYWYVKGHLIYYSHHIPEYRPNANGGTTYAWGTSYGVYDFGKYVTYDNDNTNNYFYDIDGNEYYYDYGDQNYTDNSGQTYNTINLDYSTIPEEDLQAVLDMLYAVIMSEVSGTLTLYGLISQILSALQNMNGVDGSSIDYTSLLSQINTALAALSSNIATHSDVAALAELLSDIKYAIQTQSDFEYNYTSKLESIIDKLDILLKSISVDQYYLGSEQDILYLASLTSLQLTFDKKFEFLTSLSDIVKKALEEYEKASLNPSIDFKVNGFSYSIDFSLILPYIDTFRFLIAAFIYLCFAWNTYRRIPSYINNGGER